MKKAAMAVLPAALTTVTFVSQANAQSVYMSTSHKASRVHASRIELPKGTEGSTNWAGYVTTSSTGSPKYTSVTGSWTVPKVSGTPTSLGSQWIGLGGVTSSDLLQMGTIEQLQGHREVATLFWEKLPASAQNLVTVPVGSKVAASISTKGGSNWSLDFRVVEPSGRILKKHISVSLNSDYVAGIGTSAEWISEDPSDQNGRLYPLASTGVVKFTQTEANGKPISSSANQVHPVALVTSSGQVRIAPSALSSGGTSFSTVSIGNQSLSGWNSHRRDQFRTKGKLYHGHLR
jgi:hypothetical protein